MQGEKFYIKEQIENLCLFIVNNCVQCEVDEDWKCQECQQGYSPSE